MSLFSGLLGSLFGHSPYSGGSVFSGYGSTASNSLFNAHSVLGIGGALSGIGHIRQGRVDSRIAGLNAELAERNAIVALQDSRERARQAGRAQRQLLGRQRATYGASGVQLTGSPLDVIADDFLQGEYQKLNILRSGVIESQNYRYQADKFRLDARQSRRRGLTGAIGSIFNTIGSSYLLS